jgi:RNA polymerase sigma-32 factor
MANELTTYLSDLRRIPRLTRERERELARAFRDRGDRAAGHLLVTSNLGFVVRLALRYRPRGRRLADLVQEGNLGLVRAVETFDPGREVRLITYAEPWIRARMLNQILHGWSLVKLGTTPAQRRLFFSMGRTQEELRQRLDPSDPEPEATVVDQLARHFRASPFEVESMRGRLAARDVSLDTPTKRGTDPIVDCLESATPRADDLLSSTEEATLTTARVASALACLDSRERLVVELRVLAHPTATLQAAGLRLGCSGERARQLEQRAMGKLRACMETCGATKGSASHCASLRVVRPASGRITGSSSTS